MILHSLISTLPVSEYYRPPPDRIFEAIKEASILVWKTYDDDYNYVTEKLARVEPIQNIGDNAWYLVAMFDIQNQRKLWELLPDDIQTEIILYCTKDYS